VTFHAEDEAFKTVVQMMQKTAKTYEVFHVVQTFLARPERLILLLRKNPGAVGKFVQCAFDGVPFFNREGAADHILGNFLDRICSVEDVPCEAPRGNFPQVARCPFSHRPIAAPNHHSYRELLREHYTLHGQGMGFERFCEKLEISKDPADIAAWVERMGVRKLYHLRPLEEGLPPVAPVADELEAALAERERDGEGESDVESGTTFSSLSELRTFLISQGSRYFRESDSVRLAGTELQKVPEPMRRFIEFSRQQQQRFPLETAYAMRSKFRHHRLHVFKRGKKGISYVSAVARRRRLDGEPLPELEERILDFIGVNPLTSAAEIAAALCGGGEGEQSEIQKALEGLRRRGFVTEFEDGTLLTHPRMGAGRGQCGGERTGVRSVQMVLDDFAGAEEVEEECHCGGDCGENPEAAGDAALRPAPQLEVVVDRRHAEDAPAGELAEVHLGNDGQCLCDKYGPCDCQCEGLLQQECGGAQEASHGQGTGISHEDACGMDIVPEEGEQGTDQGGQCDA
jgi:hypothetical protein